ncbi:MAG: OmpA family protein [Planctomycetota bacterium]
MRRLRAFGLMMGLVVVAGGLSGCNRNIKEERDMLYAEALDLREENARLSEALDASEMQRGDLASDMSRIRMENTRLARELEQAQTAPPSTTMGQNTGGGFGGIENVRSESRPGEVAAVVEGDILFDSGSVTLKQSARSTLNEIAQVLNGEYADRMVRIEGHTDTDPIRKSEWKTNMRLSAERAMAVRDYLESRGVDEDRMYIAGFGPIRPESTKQQSRRVEIAVVLNNGR